MENNNLKILLVDDDRFLLDMYSLKFKKANVDIDPVGSSLGALEKLRGGTIYDVIILDIIMPTMDGLDLLKTIRGEKLCQDAVIIMLTNQSEDIEKARALVIDGYIIKATTIPSEVVEQVLNIYKNKQKK